MQRYQRILSRSIIQRLNGYRYLEQFQYGLSVKQYKQISDNKPLNQQQFEFKKIANPQQNRVQTNQKNTQKIEESIRQFRKISKEQVAVGQDELIQIYQNIFNRISELEQEEDKLSIIDELYTYDQDTNQEFYKIIRQYQPVLLKVLEYIIVHVHVDTYTDIHILKRNLRVICCVLNINGKGQQYQQQQTDDNIYILNLLVDIAEKVLSNIQSLGIYKKLQEYIYSIYLQRYTYTSLQEHKLQSSEFISKLCKFQLQYISKWRESKQYTKEKQKIVELVDNIELLYKLDISPKQAGEILGLIFYDLDSRRANKQEYEKSQKSLNHLLGILKHNVFDLSPAFFSFLTYVLSKTEIFIISQEIYDELWIELAKYLEQNKSKLTVNQLKSIFYSIGKVGIKTPQIEQTVKLLLRVETLQKLQKNPAFTSYLRNIILCATNLNILDKQNFNIKLENYLTNYIQNLSENSDKIDLTTKFTFQCLKIGYYGTHIFQMFFNNFQLILQAQQNQKGNIKFPVYSTIKGLSILESEIDNTQTLELFQEFQQLPEVQKLLKLTLSEFLQDEEQAQFQSSPELLAATLDILQSYNIQYQNNILIEMYRVDIYIPEKELAFMITNSHDYLKPSLETNLNLQFKAKILRKLGINYYEIQYKLYENPHELKQFIDSILLKHYNNNEIQGLTNNS